MMRQAVATLPDPGSDAWTHEHSRVLADRMSDHLADWQGVPVHLPDFRVQLHDRHPYAELFDKIDTADVEIEVVVGGPNDMDEDEHLANRWYDGKRNRDVLVFHRTNGRAFAIPLPRAPDRSMERLALWLKTIGASDAWDLDAEYRARTKLRSLLSDRQWRHYDLTGSFLETSPRSQLTYVFRRLRPTVVLTPRTCWWRQRDDSGMRCLAVLCLHPVGFYDRTWGGCMVPTDDVIAHLLTMRADEAYFWRKANQHEASAPEAGL